MDTELRNAAIEGDVEFLKIKLVSSKVSDEYFLSETSYLGAGGTNILHLASWKDKVEFVKGCIDLLPSQVLQKLISKQDGDGWNPLYVAAGRSVEIVRLLLGFYKSYKGPPLVSQDPNHPLNKPWLAVTSLFYDSKTPLHRAILCDEEESAMEILSMDKELLCNMLDGNNSSPLFLAVRRGCNRVAESILESCPSYELSGENGSTPFHFAPNSSEKVLEMLLDKHPELIEKDDKDGWNVLHQWAYIGKVWPLEFIFKKKELHEAQMKIFGELLMKGDIHENNPLHIAVQNKKVEFVLTLLTAYEEIIGSQANNKEIPWKMKNKEDKTALAIALESQLLSLALSFLSKQSSLLKTDVSREVEQVVGEIPKAPNFDWLESCPENMLKLLLQNRTDFLEAHTSDGCNVLHFWASKGDVPHLKMLCQGNKLKSAKDTVFTKLIHQVDNKIEDNPVHTAVRNGDDSTNFLEELIQVYNREYKRQDIAPWEKQNKDGDTPLHLAFKLDKDKVALYLLSKSAPGSLHSRNNQRKTPLILGIQKQSNIDIQLKIALKTNLQLVDEEHQAVVNWLRFCPDDVLQEVIKNNPNFLEAIDSTESNVLHKWAQDGKVSALDKISEENLIKLVEKQDKDMRNTPLHVATRSNQNEFVKNLVDKFSKNLPWKAQNKDGDTPLHLAISSKNSDLVFSFFKYYPLVSKIRNKDGETPFFLAVKSGLDDVVEKMLNHENVEITFSMLRNDQEMTVLHLLPNVSDRIAKKLLQKFWWIIKLRNKEGRSAFDMVEGKQGFEQVRNWLEDPSEIEDKSPLDCFRLCETKDQLEIVLSSDQYDFLHNIKLKNYQDYLSLLKNPLIQELKNHKVKGRTPLHQALMNKDIAFAKALLIDDKVERNIKDEQGQTAMDLLSELCNKNKDWKYMCKLINVDPHLKTYFIQPGTNMEQMRDTLSVVAALLATITFAAGFTLPGGLHSESGHAILAKNGVFLAFLLANAFAMCTSMLVLFCLIWSMVSDLQTSYILVDASVQILVLSLYGTLIAFTTGIYATVAPSSRWAAIVISSMCGLSGSLAVSKRLLPTLILLFRNPLCLTKVVLLFRKEESPSTGENIHSQNSRARGNKLVETFFSIILKLKKLISMKNQDGGNSRHSLEEALTRVGSSRRSPATGGGDLSHIDKAREQEDMGVGSV